METEIQIEREGMGAGREKKYLMIYPNGIGAQLCPKLVSAT